VLYGDIDGGAPPPDPPGWPPGWWVDPPPPPATQYLPEVSPFVSALVGPVPPTDDAGSLNVEGS